MTHRCTVRLMKKVIVGLGNPGKNYEKTRHNAGQIVIEKILHEYFLGKDTSDWKLDKKVNARIKKISVDDGELVFVFPDSYMNVSGESVRQVLKRENLETGDLIVIHDELDLPLGTFKLSFGRGAGGHNGVSSVIASLGTNEFIRIRIGIGRNKEPGLLAKIFASKKGKDYVLGKFAPVEIKELEQISKDVYRAILTLGTEGKEVAMNKFN